MRQRKIPFAAMLLLTLVLLAAPMLTLNFASRRGSPAADVSIEALALEDDHFSMTASLEGKSAAAFRRAAWEIKKRHAVYYPIQWAGPGWLLSGSMEPCV